MLACGGGRDPASPVTGFIVGVDARPGLQVVAFRLLLPTSETVRFRVGSLDLSRGGFPAVHLREHEAAGMPVRVTFHREGYDLVATRLEDG